MSLTPTLLSVAPRAGIGTIRLDPPFRLEPERPRTRRRPPGRAARAAVATGGAVLLLISSTQWSHAATVYFPISEYGSRGTNVVAIQYLLRFRGYELPPTGWYGPMTYGAVRSFQRHAGLPVTGRVDGRTWLRMAPNVIIGQRGNAVRAVQALLNAKLPAGLAVDGVFGRYTEAAVKAFQKRYRLEPDGGVGPITWRHLAWAYRQPSFTWAAVCAYPTGANGHNAHYGTSHTVAALDWAARRVHAAGHGAVAVGDISRRNGGWLQGHRMHRLGLEADLRPMRRDETQCSNRVTWYRWSDGRKVCCHPQYDRAATRQLVIALRSTGLRVREIAFNDPALVKEGLTRYFAGHDDHIHVTFCERSHRESYYRC